MENPITRAMVAASIQQGLIAPTLDGGALVADMVGLAEYYEARGYEYAGMFGYIICQETRDYTEDIEEGLEASDLDFDEVYDAIYHTFELMAEDAARDPDDYAAQLQRCCGYLSDGLGEDFDQTASYVYTNPAGDSWEIRICANDEVASPIVAEPEGKQAARHR